MKVLIVCSGNSGNVIGRFIFPTKEPKPVFCLKNGTPMITYPLNDNYANLLGEFKYSSLLKQFRLIDTNFFPYRSKLTSEVIFDMYEDESIGFESKKEEVVETLVSYKQKYLDFLNKKI